MAVLFFLLRRTIFIDLLAHFWLQMLLSLLHCARLPPSASYFICNISLAGFHSQPNLNARNSFMLK